MRFQPILNTIFSKFSEHIPKLSQLRASINLFRIDFPQKQKILVVDFLGSTSPKNKKSWWLLLDRFQKFAFSMKTIRLHGDDIIITISFPNLSTLETVFKSYRFEWGRSSFLIVFVQMQGENAKKSLQFR